MRNPKLMEDLATAGRTARKEEGTRFGESRADAHGSERLFPMKPKSQLWYGPRHSMRAFRSAAFVTLGFLCFTLGASRAEAKECTNPLVNTCINADTLWPNPGPMRFTGVSGTELLGGGQVGFGLLGSYHSRPVLLHVASPGGEGSDQAVIDHQVNGNFLFAYGVTD